MTESAARSPEAGIPASDRNGLPDRKTAREVRMDADLSKDGLHVETEVYKPLEMRFDMTGRALGRPLMLQADVAISPGLQKRLLNYCTEIMVNNGFPITDRVVISKIDEDDSHLNVYQVGFVNEKGGRISVVGILIGRGGHPCLDHGLSIEAAPF